MPVSSIRKNQNRGRSASRDRGSSCRNCGRSPHSKDDCPAAKSKCHNCSIIGHWSNFCSKPKKGQPKSRKKCSTSHQNRSSFRVPFSASLRSVTSCQDRRGFRLSFGDPRYWRGSVRRRSGSTIQLDVQPKKLLPPPEGKLISFDGSAVACIGILPIVVQNAFKKFTTEVYICPGAGHNFLLVYGSLQEARIYSRRFSGNHGVR